MRLKSQSTLLGLILILFSLGCSNSPDLSTPGKIGAKDRVRLITGNQAARVINKMHRSAVASDANIIAEYGRDKKDLLYITYYTDQKNAKKAFDLMVEKMAATKNSPFFHLKPLGGYQNKAYITLGMGAVHYIYLSGTYLLWLQTHQSFGSEIPARLLKLYPI
jgi:hypothetical protein